MGAKQYNKKHAHCYIFDTLDKINVIKSYEKAFVLCLWCWKDENRKKKLCVSLLLLWALVLKCAKRIQLPVVSSDDGDTKLFTQKAIHKSQIIVESNHQMYGQIPTAVL